MEINYQISTEQQRRQILAGENAKVNQIAILPDSDLRTERGGEAILSHPLTKIGADGTITLELGVPALLDKSIYASADCGPAGGNVLREEWYLCWPGAGVWCPNMRYPLDSMIRTVSDLAEILAEIDVIASERQAEADKKTRESAETFQARIDAYNANHRRQSEPKNDAEPENDAEADYDSYQTYRSLDGLELMLQYGRERQAKSMVLDFLEVEFAANMSERGFEMLNIDDLECSSLENYEGDIPGEALRELVKLADIDGTPYVYYEDADPYIGLDVSLKFMNTSRLVVVNVFQWDTDA